MGGQGTTSTAHSTEVLVGRDRDLNALLAALADASLVTVMGLGGVGKTSLAKAAVAAHRERHGEKSASWCDIADATTREEVVTTLARVMDIEFAASGLGREEREGVLSRSLAGLGSHLLAVDNAEQVASAVADLTSRWRGQCPGLRILVTSRERLGSSGEQQYALAPLALPKGDDAPWCAAVELFVKRVRRFEPAYAPDAPELELIGQVVQELDGLPLAIELAAARVPLLGVSALLERLVDRFRILNRAPVGTVPRHATLWAAIAWSWELLDEVEAGALAQCSTFRGGFTLAAAEQVLDLPTANHANHDGSVVDVLQNLLDKSLIESGPNGGRGKRLRLSANIRAYAEARLLETENPSAVHSRHAEYFAIILASKAVLHDRDNLLAVGERGLLEPALFPAAVRAIVVLANVVGGPRQRVAELLDAAIRKVSDPSHSFSLLRARANHRRRGGDVEGAIEDAKEAAVLVAEEPDPTSRALAMTDLGLALSERGSTQEAQATLEEAAALHRSAENESETARVLVALGDLLQGTGELSAARAYLTEALGIYERSDATSEHIRALLNLANVDATASSQLAARGHYEDARRLAEQNGEPYLAAYAVMGNAFTHHDAGEPRAAQRHYQNALAAFEELGQLRDQGLCHSYLGVLAHSLGDLRAAVDHGQRAWALLEKAGNRRYGALALGRLACACASAENWGDADAYLARARELARGDDDPLSSQVHALHDAFIELERGPERGAAALPAAVLASSAETDSLSFGVRLARRTLAAKLAAPNDAAAEAGLVVAADGRWFQRGGAQRVDLSRRRALRQVVAVLAARRLAEPGAATSLDALFEAGWPGTHLAPDHAANRVYNVLSELRGMGLRDVLISRDDGYLLDPALDVRGTDLDE